MENLKYVHIKKLCFVEKKIIYLLNLLQLGGAFFKNPNILIEFHTAKILDECLKTENPTLSLLSDCVVQYCLSEAEVPKTGWQIKAKVFKVLFYLFFSSHIISLVLLNLRDFYKQLLQLILHHK